MKVKCRYVDLDIYPGATFCELFSGTIDTLEVISECSAEERDGHTHYIWKARDIRTGQEIEYDISDFGRLYEPKLFNNEFEARMYQIDGPSFLEILYG